MKNLNYIDLCAGIGGFRQAASTLGHSAISLTPMGHMEIDPVADRFYRCAHGVANHDRLFGTSDVMKMAAAKHLSAFDGLMAGFPCQNFSAAGLRGSFADERSNVFRALVQILHKCQPVFFVLENVANIKKIKATPWASHSRTAHAVVMDELRSPGYAVKAMDMSAEDYGLPQRRHRVIYLGVRLDVMASLDGLRMPETVSLDTAQYPTTWHLLERDLPRSQWGSLELPMNVDARRRRLTVRNMRTAGENGPMQGLIDLPVARTVLAQLGSGWADETNYYSETYMNGNTPNEQPRVNLMREPIRRLTIKEAFRLQGFPDRFAEIAAEQELGYTVAGRLVGNAVPVNLARAALDQFMTFLAPAL